MTLRPNTEDDVIVQLRLRADNLDALCAPAGIVVERVGLVGNPDGTFSFMASGSGPPPADMTPVDLAAPSKFTQPFSTVIAALHHAGTLEQAITHRNDAADALQRMGFELVGAATNQGADNAKLTGTALIDGDLAVAIGEQMAEHEIDFEAALRNVLRERGAELPDDDRDGEA